MATRFKNHPAIGIARVGNSPEFFLGPERPHTYSPPPDGTGARHLAAAVGRHTYAPTGLPQGVGLTVWHVSQWRRMFPDTAVPAPCND